MGSLGQTSVLSSLLAFNMRVLLTVLALLHVRLDGSPQRPDVPLSEPGGSAALDQLQEERVLREHGLGEHLQQVPVGKIHPDQIATRNPAKRGSAHLYLYTTKCILLTIITIKMPNEDKILLTKGLKWWKKVE